MALFRNDDDESKEKQPETIGEPKVLPLLPLRDIVVFPGMVVPLFRRAPALDQGLGRRQLRKSAS